MKEWLSVYRTTSLVATSNTFLGQKCGAKIFGVIDRVQMRVR